ncbi:signal recognition particle-docking protein FtsY [Rhodanobacter sp. L36]|uniref:signal recognition particle-docking protein FtsY n=1 Tax=Rhodanobacter sp. L36 TaxID=1747221 RepID=UPI00131D0A7B|nr:signal recognition particle-docking protein FtsY [Rhodanobacter sp. L36]
MLKFWKKKPAETEAEIPIVPPADPATLDGAAPVIQETLAEVPSPAEGRTDNERFVAPIIDPTPASETEAEAAPAKRSWRERLSGNSFARGLSSLFVRHPKLDDDLLDELETTLITADVGVAASSELVENLRKRMHKREFADSPALLAALRAELVALLKPVEKPLDIRGRHPFVTLVVGINGAGKTTTIGKLARRWRDERHAVMLAAGDTFRAAAVEQLKTWGTRNDVPVISQGQDADAASVIFDALQAARSRDIDVLIADTAGRLHTQGGLMDELGKIARVLKKIDVDAPHEVLMVIDGTTGQNAVNQVRQFLQIVGVTGLVVTKLDGTAKGGVVFALAREFGLPIRFVGLGETATDLRVFEAEAFVDGLLPASLGVEGQGHD